jgi:4-hydroxy-tetrahydrodipicolinate synthase
MQRPPLGTLITAMVTPFREDGAVDYDRAAELAEKLTAEGSDGLLVTGTTGESPTLTKEEKLQLYRVVKQAAGQVPVLAGTGSNNTALSVELTRAASATGVDGILLVGPYYNKPSAEGLYQHFRACAQATELPVVIYNVPGRTGKNIEAKTILRLAEEVPNIVGVKEASGDLKQITAICAGKPDDFYVWSGDDGLTIPIMSVGGVGVISVASHVAGRQMRAMIDAFWAGEVERAAQLHCRLSPLFEALFLPSGNPACVKRALEICGFPVGGLRLPLVPASQADTDIIRRVCAELELTAA